jgi:hypothetical protein
MENILFVSFPRTYNCLNSFLLYIWSYDIYHVYALLT